MKIYPTFLYLLTVFCLISCHGDDIEPRTTPRFSIAYIQNMDNSGVEFVANVLDYGSADILEYGFLFSESGILDFEKSDVVGKRGKPSKQFTIKATYAMESGKRYQVAAYMLTSDGIVLSQMREFISEGSDGFIFQRIEMRPKVYFNDTITIHGRNLTRNPDKYDISVYGGLGEKMPIFDITENSFKTRLPARMNFDDRYTHKGVLPFHISVAGKYLEIEWPFQFRDPEFKTIPDYKVDYDGEVVIEGDFLESEYKTIRFDDNEYYEPEIIEWTKNRILFRATYESNSRQPTVRVFVRGKFYPVEKAFTFNPSELDPGQVVETEYGFNVEFTGNNFKKVRYMQNEFVSNAPSASIHTEYADEHSIRIGIYNDGGPLPREVKFWMNNGNERSQHHGTVVMTTPTLPYMDPSSVFKTKDYSLDFGRGVSMDGEAYFIWRNQIIKFDASNQNLQQVINPFLNVNNLAAAFAISSPNGKIYIGSHDRDYNWQYIKLYEFDPDINQLTELPRVPHGVVTVKYAYATDQYLYLDGGVADVEVTDRYRYNLQTRIWEKLDKTLPVTGYYGAMKPFHYKGGLYAFGQVNLDDPYNSLQVFNPTTEEWDLIKQFEKNGSVATNEPLLIGDDLYLIYGWENVKVDMRTFEEQQITNLGQIANFASLNNAVVSDGKIYIYQPFGLIHELDPQYFKY